MVVTTVKRILPVSGARLPDSSSHLKECAVVSCTCFIVQARNIQLSNHCNEQRNEGNDTGRHRRAASLPPKKEDHFGTGHSELG